jgi:hypothetical protein
MKKMFLFASEIMFLGQQQVDFFWNFANKSFKRKQEVERVKS